jgi:hypothetical protein
MTESASVFVTKDIFRISHTLTCQVLSVLTRSLYCSQSWKLLQKLSKEFKDVVHVFIRILSPFFVKGKGWTITTMVLSSYQSKVHFDNKTESISYFDITSFTPSTYHPSRTDKRDGDTRKKM